MSSCTGDFESINTTPNQPTQASPQWLINGIVSTLVLQWSEQASLHVDWYYPATQLGGESALSGYLLVDGVSSVWKDYYTTLENINLVQDKISATSDVEAYNNIQGILNVLKAYKTFRVTDQFGDIPYFNAGKTYKRDVAYYRPAYDDQSAIYDDLLKGLQWAVDNFNLDPNAKSKAGNTYVNLGTSDVLFKNDISQWQKFANSLLLRYSMQMVEKNPSGATPYIQYAMQKNLFIDDGADVGIWPGQLNLVLGGRPWSFGSGGTGFLRVSTTLWNMLSDGTSSNQIFDPRALVWASPNAAGSWAPYLIGTTVSDKVNPYLYTNDAVDLAGCVFSPFNPYLVRDQHYIPELIMTSAETHFLKAEALIRGFGVAQSTTAAQAEYVAGITASVNFWESIAAGTDTTEDPWSTSAPIDFTPYPTAALLSNPKVAFTTVDADNLKKIYAQEWLDAVRQPWLAFNLWRRTGQTPVDPSATPDAAHQQFYRLPYPQDEAVLNTGNYNTQIAKIGANTSAVKVWWMK